MNPVLEQLVQEAMEVTGSPMPELMEDDAPVLDEATLTSGREKDVYFVGLIGGKEVGKSALINAIVGEPITAVTSHGAGTEMAIAYAHVSQKEALQKLLDREVTGQYRIFTHELPELKRQVLLDLPDIDSRYAAHLQVTRTMLRHILYPVWVGSVEKYADAQPQQMLLRVAEGNTPGNFIFVLNKVDQLKGQEVRDGNGDSPSPVPVKSAAAVKTSRSQSQAASTAVAAKRVKDRSPIEELQEDCAERMRLSLHLPEAPRVFMVSARHPDQFEMPALRAILRQQKSEEEVRQSRLLAAARQEQALIAWLESQDLATRAQRLGRLQEGAEELVGVKVAGPILERIVPRLMEDPATRSAMADDVLGEQIVHWPVLAIVHPVIQPLFALLRSAVSRSPTTTNSSEAMIEALMKESGESVESMVQSAFAQLRHSQPAVAPLYEQNKLWESIPAEESAGQLRQILARSADRQRAAALEYLTAENQPRYMIVVRWVLTVGALIWFPFLQPILATAFGPPVAGPGGLVVHVSLLGAIVSVLGVDYLLKSVGFLIIYFLSLWLALRWYTQRKVGRLLARWKKTESPDASTNLAAQTMQWLETLTAPIRGARQRVQCLVDGIAEYKRDHVVAQDS